MGVSTAGIVTEGEDFEKDRVEECLSSIILSPLNGNVKMSPHETGDIHVATTG